MRHRILAGFTIVLLAAATAGAETYYVDYAAGDDSAAGTSLGAAWQHAPGDRAAADKAKAVSLQPGDVVRFKGGVVYRGSISVTDSGAEGKPIVYDGNADGRWGEGRAIIDGSVPLEDLKRCTSADDVWGNPNYERIYWTTVPAGARWKSINVSQGLVPMAWSQDPNPSDPVFQEKPAEFYKTDPLIPQTLTNVRVEPVGMGTNSGRPLLAMFDGSRLSAVIENMNGGAVKVTLDDPVTVAEFGVTPQPRYVNPKVMSFHIGGEEVLRAELAYHPDEKVEQRFKLDEPVTFRELTIRFDSAHPLPDGTKRNWGAIQAIAGYDAEGENVLLANRRSVLRNDEVFTQDDPNYYDNAFLALYARPAAVYYKRIVDFDPQANRIRIETLGHGQIPYPEGGAFSIVNSPRFIDMPGEYALVLEPEADGSHKLFVWPPDGTPENLTRGAHGLGIGVRGSYVTVRSFWIRKQGWDGSSGISGRGQASNLVIRDCKVTNLRGNGVGIHTTGIDTVLVDDCEVADNAGHTKGIVLRNASNIVTRNSTLRKNSSTALDYYTVTNGAVQNCLVTENQGMHANGLTFYVGCKDILVEGNWVRDGNVGLTVQDGDRMIIRNNIIEGGRGGAPAIGLWSGKPYNNIVMTNNVLRYYGSSGSSSAAIYGGNADAHGYAIVNNVIDGFSGLVTRKADYHHNVFTRTGPTLPKSRLGDNRLVPDLDAIFVDAEAGDYHLKPDSPAIGAGVAVTSINRYDRAGVDRAADDRYDVGPYEFVPAQMAGAAEVQPIDPRTFEFSFDGYTITEPEPYEPEYEMRFEKREGAEAVVLKGIDRSDEGGGEVNLRPNRGGYISGWDDAGHWLEWTVEVPAAGPYEVAITHASETPATRRVLLDGQPVEGLQEVFFPATGAWRAFAKTGLPQPLMLKAGKNAVRFINVKGSLNFKRLEFIPVVTE